MKHNSYTIRAMNIEDDKASLKKMLVSGWLVLKLFILETNILSVSDGFSAQTCADFGRSPNLFFRK